jgi:hypothetical protein
MLTRAFYPILFLGFFVFMVNRLYVGLRDGQLRVKGWVYSRAETPLRFWSTMVMAALAAVLGLLLLAAVALH